MDFQHDGSGHLIQVVDTLDRSIAIYYNAVGFISSVEDFAGRVVRYEYYQNQDPGGSFGDPKSVTTPAVDSTAAFPIPARHQFPLGKTMAYTYSEGTGSTRLDHNLLTITDPKGQTYLTNEYYPVVDPQSLNFDRIRRQVSGDPGDIIDYVNAGVPPGPGNNLAVLRVIVNDRVGNVREYFYDHHSRQVMRREFTGRADPDSPTTPTQNRPTNKLRSTDPGFFETRTTYNIDSRVARTLHPNGNETLRIHEADLDPQAARRSRGNVREIRRRPGPLGGDQDSLVMTFEYDTGFGGCCGTNFVTRAKDARGNETLHDYDDHGNRIHTQYALPEIVEYYQYNQYGQIVRHTLPGNGSGWRREDTGSRLETRSGSGETPVALATPMPMGATVPPRIRIHTEPSR